MKGIPRLIELIGIHSSALANRFREAAATRSV
jgi:hypothetical protein